MSPGGGGGREVLSGFHLAWVREPDLPPGDRWLSTGERSVLAALKLPKRRKDWLLGRWAAKKAVGSILEGTGGGDPCPHLDPEAASTVEILAADNGRPRVRLGAHWPGATIRISISHAGGVGFAIAAVGGADVGCDVEVLEPRSGAFVSDYLTPGESAIVRAAARQDAILMANLAWSAKESALKVLGQGLRMDTREVEVELPPARRLLGRPTAAQDNAGVGAWRPLRVFGPDGARFSGSWRTRDGLVWTVLSGA